MLCASLVVRKALLKVTNVIFFKIPVVKVSIFHIAMFLSTAALVMTSMDLMNKSKADDNTRFFEQKCQRWRAERNFWISILAFSMYGNFCVIISHHKLFDFKHCMYIRWMILRRFIAITREAQTYRDEIRKAEKTR